MARPLQQPRGRPELHDAPGIHGRDAVGHALQQAQIVGDDEHRGPELTDQRHEGLDHLYLDQRIERRGGFVGDDQIWSAGERGRDGCALQHSARELMRVGLRQPRRVRHSQACQQVGDTRIGGRRIQATVQLQRSPNLRSHPSQGVEGAKRILRHEGDPGATQGGGSIELRRADGVTPEPDLTGADAARATQQAQHGQAKRRLAAAGFPDHAGDLTGPHGEIDAPQDLATP